MWLLKAKACRCAFEKREGGNEVHTNQTTNKHVLPMVSIVVYSRNSNKGSEKQRKNHDAKFCHMTFAIKRLNFAR
jgi:hypothetical protein